MGRILRCDIVWANLDQTIGNEQAGERPVLILSHTVFDENSGTVIAVALTSKEQKAGYPLTIEISSKKLPKTSYVKISQIKTLSVNRLGERITHLKDEELVQVVEGLKEIIGG
ncbi:MAG: type II toxin-antitoxin system PemK/MazF family toxin [Bacteroidota bacterium]